MQKSWYKVVRVRRKIKMSRFKKKNVLKSHCFFFSMAKKGNSLVTTRMMGKKP